VRSKTQLKLREIVTRLGFRSDWYLILLAAGIGAIASAGAIAFAWLIRTTEQQTEHALHATIYIMPFIPMAGAVLCGMLVHFFASEARGHGVPEVMHALIKKGGKVRPRVAVVKSLASACTIGSGGSAGAEGPIAQIGAAIGSSVGQLLHVSRDHQQTLLGCGVAAGIASIFNAPIAGIFFVLEILLRDFRLRIFTPIVIASVISAGITQAYAGDDGAIFSLPAAFKQAQVFNLFELPAYVVLGFVCGAVAAGFTWMLYFSEDLFDRVRMHPIAKPVVGAAILGVLGLATVIIARRSGSEMLYPPFFGNGYPFIKNLLDPAFYVEQPMLMIIGGLALVGLLKAVGTVLTLGSGGSGGVFAPSLFMGACTGGALGIGMARATDAVVAVPHGPAAAYALVGMAAVVAGTTHAPLTAILMLFEITGDYRVILPIMLAAVIATAISQLIDRDSIYTRKLRRRGLRVGGFTDLTLLRRLIVDQVPYAQALTIQAEDSVARLLEKAGESQVHDYIVVDEEEGYLGMVTGEDVRTALLQPEAIPLLLVAELMRCDLPVVTREETLDAVLDKFAHCDVTSLAIVDESERKSVIGLLSRREVMDYYQHAIDATDD
jgi:CIC family chloride channel protein